MTRMVKDNSAAVGKLFNAIRDQRDAAVARAEAAEAEVARLRAALYTIAHSLDTTPGQPPTLEDAQAIAEDALDK